MSAPPGELNFKIDHLMQYAAVNKFLTRNVQGRKYLCIAAGDVLVNIKCAMTLLTYRKTLYVPSRVQQHLWWLIYRAEYLLRKMTAFTAVHTTLQNHMGMWPTVRQGWEFSSFAQNRSLLRATVSESLLSLFKKERCEWFVFDSSESLAKTRIRSKNSF